MSDFRTIQQQIVELQKQAVEARKTEVSAVIADIKAKMKEYDLTPADFGFKGTFKPSKQVGVVAPKYRDPKTGKTWTGRGKSPVWLSDALKDGKTENSYLISVQEQKASDKADKVKQSTVAKKAAPQKPVAVKKAPAKKAPTKKAGAEKVVAE